MQNDRIEWIDMAKGLGMLLIMLGHTPFPPFIVSEFYTFHVPLFFFISGYLFNILKYNNFKKLCKRLLFTLLIPYLSLSFINVIYWMVKNYRHKPLDNDAIHAIIGIFYAVRNTDWTTIVGPMWFIPCLIFTEIIFYFVIKFTKGRTILIISLLFLCSLISYFYSIYIEKPLPWSVDASICATVFFGIGYLIRQKSIKLDNYTNLKFMIIYIAINVVFGFLNYRYSGKRVDMFRNEYGVYFFYYISAISGIMVSLAFVRILVKLKVLIYIGNNSIIFLGFHQYILYPIIAKLLSYVSIFKNTDFITLALKGILYIVIAYLALIPITYIIKRFFPFILGKRFPNRSMKINNIPI